MRVARLWPPLGENNDEDATEIGDARYDYWRRPWRLGLFKGARDAGLCRGLYPA